MMDVSISFSNEANSNSDYACIICIADCDLYIDKIGDGICDEHNNKEECLYDDNDCCEDCVHTTASSSSGKKKSDLNKI